jgi:ABC-type multidrug transport system ATPase subunit
MLSPQHAGDLSLHNVSRSFGTVEVLRDVNVHLGAGSITEIIGDNGAGKTSLLRMVAGTLEPSSGSIDVAGRPPGRGMAALVPAGDRALYWRLTGRQELEFFARVTGVSRAQAAETASEAAAALDIEILLDRQIGTFSTGQRRRLMVARSLVGLAPILLFDEPYSDLDHAACEVVERVARRWVEHDGLVVWTSPTAGGGPPPDRRFRLTEGTLVDG